MNEEISDNYQIKEIKIFINNKNILELEFSSKKNFFEFPFYCFSNTNSSSSIEELNFNELKKCEANKNTKYLVIFLKKFENSCDEITPLNKNFSEWHSIKPDVKFELFLGNTTVYHHGKMLKIFHKEYQPTTAK